MGADPVPVIICPAGGLVVDACGYRSPTVFVCRADSSRTLISRETVSGTAIPERAGSAMVPTSADSHGCLTIYRCRSIVRTHQPEE